MINNTHLMKQIMRSKQKQRSKKRNKLKRTIALLVTVCGVTLVGILGLAKSSAQASPPNVVFIMIDDARPDEMSLVAGMKPGGGFDWIRSNGTVFDKVFSANNACCPGRAIAMTGQTSYNNGVLTNVTWKDLSSGLQSWLSQAGYCTGFVGKWLNPYNGTQPTPAGWTYWEAITAGLADPNDPEDDSYTIMKRDGTTWQPGVYMTDHLANLSRAQLADCLDSGSPAMVAFWPYAPHLYTEPEPDYANIPVSWSNTDPTFNEADISDKPAWLQNQYPNQDPNLATIAYETVQHRVRTMLSVDDAVKGLIDELDARGQLDNTLVVLQTDNGFLLGEHRIFFSKLYAYDAAQPTAWIAGPGFEAGATSDAYVTTIDIVPTIVEATGITPGLVMDGRSIQSVLAEGNGGRNRFLPIRVATGLTPSYLANGVRTSRYTYVAYKDGSEEIYDNYNDPYQETNIIDTVSANVKDKLVTLLQDAMACSGDSCRADAPPALRKPQPK